MRFVAAQVGVLFVLTAPPGCEEEIPSDRLRPHVALLIPSQTDAFFAAIAEGARAVAHKAAVAVLIQETSQGSEQAYRAAVTGALDGGANVLLIWATDPVALRPALRIARTRGAPVLLLCQCIDQVAGAQPDPAIAAMVGPDEVVTAATCASHVVAAAARASGPSALLDVGILVGGELGAIAALREKGFQQGRIIGRAATRPRRVDVQSNNPSEVRAVVRRLLSDHPNLACVLCTSDELAISAVRAIDEDGKTGKILVGGIGNSQSARQAIQAGRMLATMDLQPALIGKSAMGAALKAATGQKMFGSIPVPAKLVTRATLPAEPKAPSQPGAHKNQG